MIPYILKFTGCLLVLYSFYRLFLENEKNHKFKRFYLLFALLASLIIPLITFTYAVELNDQSNLNNDLVIPSITTYQETTYSDTVEETSLLETYLPLILWLIYGVGIVLFSIRLFKNLRYLNNLIEKHEKVMEDLSIKVLLPFNQIPYSFFRYIFVDKEAFRTKIIPEEILKHEEAHVIQKHTLDLLILELLQIIFWFNPLFGFIKKSMRLNHEFLADDAVLKQNISASSYSNLLVTSSFGISKATITSSFKHSLIKKRIIMISNSFSRKRIGLKMGFLVPVVCCCIYFFNNDIVAKVIPVNKKAFINIENLELSKSELPVTSDSLVYGRINYLNTKNGKGLKIFSSRWAIKNRVDHINGNKNLNISIEGQKLKINNEYTNPIEFVQVVNSQTHSWTKKEIMLYKLTISLDSKENPLFHKISREYRKTNIFKIDPSHEMSINEPISDNIIDEIINTGGNFYFNNEKISAERATQLIKETTLYNYIKFFDENEKKMTLRIWNNEAQKPEKTKEIQINERSNNHDKKILSIGITTGHPPSNEQMRNWKNKKNIKFFWENKPITKSQLNSFNLNAVLVSKEYKKENETLIYFETTYTQYFKMSPKSLNFGENNQSYGVNKIFLDNKIISDEELKQYSPNDISEFWFVQDGKLPNDKNVIWKLFTKPVDIDHSSWDRVVRVSGSLDH